MFHNVMSIFFAALTMMQSDAAYPHPPQPGGLRITVVFNNVPHLADLETGWGFSCLVEGLGKTILFDTGADGEVLLANMRRLELSPKTVETVVISHLHHDHTGGLDALLAANPDLEVWLPIKRRLPSGEPGSDPSARAVDCSAMPGALDRFTTESPNSH